MTSQVQPDSFKGFVSGFRDKFLRGESEARGDTPKKALYKQHSISTVPKRKLRPHLAPFAKKDGSSKRP